MDIFIMTCQLPFPLPFFSPSLSVSKVLHFLLQWIAYKTMVIRILLPLPGYKNKNKRIHLGTLLFWLQGLFWQHAWGPSGSFLEVLIFWARGNEPFPHSGNPAQEPRAEGSLAEFQPLREAGLREWSQMLRRERRILRCQQPLFFDYSYFPVWVNLLGDAFRELSLRGQQDLVHGVATGNSGFIRERAI